MLILMLIMSAMIGLVTTEIGGKNEPGVDILSVVYKHGILQNLARYLI